MGTAKIIDCWWVGVEAYADRHFVTWMKRNDMTKIQSLMVKHWGLGSYIKTWYQYIKGDSNSGENGIPFLKVVLPLLQYFITMTWVPTKLVLPLERNKGFLLDTQIIIKYMLY